VSDFDPAAKDEANLSKHGISLARWVDMAILASNLSTTATRAIAATD
jgi:uncharacterized DUF497 family protein